MQVTDRDIGTNAEMDFAFSAGSPSNFANFFSVTKTGSRSADLSITREFDRENIDFFQFTIIVTDQGTPQLTDSIVRCVNIIVRSFNICELHNHAYIHSRTSMTVCPSSVL